MLNKAISKLGRIMRFGSICVASGGISLGLFFTMNSLVDSPEIGIIDRQPKVQIEFHKQLKDTETRHRIRKPNKPKPSEAPKITPPVHPKPDGKGPGVQMPKIGNEQSGPFKAKIDKAGRIAVADSGIVPLMRIQPTYPRYAAERRIEGWVTVQFIITETGAVANPQVVDARPANVFNKAAIKAIRQWKYRPKVVNGNPRRTLGRTRLVFRLDQIKG